ncbi:hypothetical protein [Dubosiella newyorkensis]|uniref:hypothetical protein n=1 Tax=Dubosiella newyorkensis TaxID=1862672 RepID=UPI003F664522
MNSITQNQRTLNNLNNSMKNARKYMHTHGNPNQWNDVTPIKRMRKEEYTKEQLYIRQTSGNGIERSFLFIMTN